MQRLIPKKTKVNTTVFRNFTIFDLAILLVFICVGLLIFGSNFDNKLIAILIVALFAVFILIPIDDERVYKTLWYIIIYIFSRKRYSKTGKRNINALIPFTEISPNGVISYGGDYYGAVVEVDSVAFDLLDENEQNRRISCIAAMLNCLNTTATLQIVKIDRPINYDEISLNLFNKLQKAQKEKNIDEAKVEILKSRENQTDNLNNINKNYRPYFYVVVYDDTVEITLQQADVVINELSKANLIGKPRILNAEEVAVFFKYCYTRNFDEREIEDIAPEDYADWIKPDKMRFTSGGCVCDNVNTFTVAISDYPLTVDNAWGWRLFNIDNTKVVLTVKPVPKDKAVKRVDRAVTEINSRKNGGKLSSEISLQTQVETMAILQRSIQNENELLFDCTLTVTGFNNAGVKDAAFRKELRRQISYGGFRMNFLTGRQYEGFAAASISRRTGLRNIDYSINSESLAAVFPFVFSSIIEPNGFYLGYDNYPLILDITKRGREYVNSNITVFGKSGSGKSYFTKTLLSLVYSENSRIFILDPENEYNVLCRNVGGRFIDVGNATEGRINPLHVYQSMTDDGKLAEPKTAFASQLQFLDSFFRLTLKGISDDSREELNNIMPVVYKRKGIDETVDCSGFTPDMFPTFDDLLEVVEDELKSEKLTTRRENLDRVKTYVKKFARGGRYAELWNGASTIDTSERLIVFNFQSLFASKNAEAANGQMLAVMRYLDQQIINIRELNRAGDNIFPFVVLDEGYNFIDPDYPIALDFVYQWYKRIRKYNGSIMFLTQNLSDILGNSQIISKTTAIINNAQYSFIFSLAPADLESLAELYKNSGGLNDTERSTISNANCGDCFVISSPRSRATFHVEASRFVESLFSDASAPVYDLTVAEPESLEEMVYEDEYEAEEEEEAAPYGDVEELDAEPEFGEADFDEASEDYGNDETSEEPFGPEDDVYAEEIFDDEEDIYADELFDDEEE